MVLICVWSNLKKFDHRNILVLKENLNLLKLADEIQKH